MEQRRTPFRLSLDTRGINTLHGFNAYAVDPPEICIGVFCQYGIPEDIVGSCSVPSDVFYVGSGYWGKALFIKDDKDRHYIPALIDACIAAKIGIRLQTMLEPVYGETDGPSHYSLENSERLAISEIKKLIELGSDHRIQGRWQWGDERLWSTTEGKDMARLLRQTYPNWKDEAWERSIFLGRDAALHPEWFDPRLDFPLPSPPEPVRVENAVPLPVPSVDPVDEPAAKRTRVEEQVDDTRCVIWIDAPEPDDVTCVICMDRPADTLVLPCEHQTVCRSCSTKLRGTADAKTCVRCRNPITEVLADGE